MTAAIYTSDLVDIFLFESTTGVSAYGGGASGLTAEPDFAMEGTNAVDKQITSSADKGFLYIAGTPFAIGVNDHFYEWIYSANFGINDTRDNHGISLCIGDDTSNFVKFHVDGIDTLPLGGGKVYTVRFVNTTLTNFRTLVGTPGISPDSIGAGLNVTGSSKDVNLGADGARLGNSYRILNGTGVDSPANLSGIATDDESTAEGIFQNTAGGFNLQGKLRVGSTLTECELTDSNTNIFLIDTIHSLSDFSEILVTHGSSILTLTNIAFIALGSTNRGQFRTLTPIIDAQDETNYDDSPTTEGVFSGGTSHVVADVITMSDGSLVTVDAVSTGVVTQFTVDSSEAYSSAAGDVLTQTATTGSGIDFTMTPDTDNIAGVPTSILTGCGFIDWGFTVLGINDVFTGCRWIGAEEVAANGADLTGSKFINSTASATEGALSLGSDAPPADTIVNLEVEGNSRGIRVSPVGVVTYNFSNVQFVGNTFDVLNDGAKSSVDSYALGSSGSSMGGINDRAIGQSFTGAAGVLSRVTFSLRTPDSPVGNMTAKLYAHSGTFGTSSIATGAALAVSEPFDVSTLTATYQDIEFEFKDQFTLGAGTKYVIAFHWTQVGDGLLFQYDPSGSHGGNRCTMNSSEVWSSDTSDVRFEVFTGGIAIINILDGGDIPSVETSGGATIVNNTVPISLAGVTEGTAIKFIANRTVGTIVAGDTIDEGFAPNEGSYEATINYEVAFDGSPETVDEYAESNQSNDNNLDASAYGRGQSFTGDGEYLHTALFYLRKKGAPTGLIFAELYAHTGTFGVSSKPTGSPLATSDLIDVATVLTAYTMVAFEFGADYQLTNGTKYVIAVRYEDGDAGNHIDVGGDNTSPSHGGNACWRTTSDAWFTTAGTDIIFDVLTGGTIGLDILVRARNQGIATAAIADDGGVFTDETTEASSNTTTDMTLLPAVPAINDAYYFGHQEQFTRLKLAVNTALTFSVQPTIIWEYWNGSSWASLTGVVDGTSGFETAGENVVSFTLPGSWATTTINSQGPFYYIRARLSVVGTITQVPVGGRATLDVSRYIPYAAERTIVSGTGLSDTAAWVEDTISKFESTD